MPITPVMIKELRDKTGAGIMDCKEALTASNGAMDEAIDFLRKKGLQAAAKRAARSTQEGMVGAYIHGGGRLGVLVEVNCETDFVARTDDFQALVHDLAMQVAASNPLYLARDDVPCAKGEAWRPTTVGIVLGNPEVTLRGPGRGNPVVKRAPTAGGA